MKFTALITLSLWTALTFSAESIKNMPQNFLKNDKIMSAKEFKQTKKQLTSKFQKKKSRTISGSVDGSASMSKEYKALNKRYLSISTPDEFLKIVYESTEWLDTCFQKPNDESCNLPSDAKLFKIQLASISNLEGITYRLRPYIEDYPAVHSRIVTLIRKISGNIFILDRSDQTKLFASYLARPTDKVATKLIKNYTNLETFISKQVIPLNTKCKEVLKAVDFSSGVTLDKKLVFGKEAYSDDINRFTIADEGDKHLLISRFARNKAYWSMMMAYNYDDLLDVVKKVGHLHGIDGFKSTLGFSKVSGATAKERASILRDFPNFLTLSKSGKYWMNIAYDNYIDAINHASLAWTVIQHRPVGSRGIYPTLQNDQFGNFVTEGIDDLQEMVQADKNSYRSLITGNVTTFNFKEFFQNPPKDLKAFLPIGFQEGKKEKEFKASNGKKYEYRNYLQDSSEKWNAAAFEPYFPDVKKQGVPTVIKTLRTSYGSSVIRSLRLPLML